MNLRKLISVIASIRYALHSNIDNEVMNLLLEKFEELERECKYTSCKNKKIVYVYILYN